MPFASAQRLQKNIGRGNRSVSLPVVAWNLLVSSFLALTACTILIGRTWPIQATFGWALTYLAIFGVSLAWLVFFSTRLGPRGLALHSLLLVEGPLLVLSVAGGAALFLSDDLYHQVTYFLEPTPIIVLLLTGLTTLIAQEGVLSGSLDAGFRSTIVILNRSRRWALPTSLVLLGLLQGASYLWVIGNDFTRYWAISDAISSLTGYPASINQGNYIEGGMYRYSIELPVFPLLLLVSFNLVGHNTLGAHMPAFLANAALPLLLYAFYRKAGFGRPVAFTASCVVVLFPFFRLYTLNAPVPDAIFVTLLVAAGYLFLHLVPTLSNGRKRNWVQLAGGEKQSPLPWAAFGLFVALSALTRPEGLVFGGLMFVVLIPNLLRRRLYVAAFAFLALTVPFALVMFTTFGIPWPRNAGTSFGLENIAANLDWMDRMSLGFYAHPFGLSRAGLVAVVGLLAVAGAAGTLWLAKKRWQMAILPASFAVHLFTVFTVDPRVSGVDQWFDFFRHFSYGIPFGALALLFLGQRALEYLDHHLPEALRHRPPILSSANLVALAALALTLYELNLLARPSLTWGAGGAQLLTSDKWVSFPDLIAHRYPLPKLPFARVEGLMMIDPTFDYIPRHLDSVKHFFEPFTVIKTGKGSQYEVSSLLVLLFGSALAFAESWEKPGKRGKFQQSRQAEDR